MSSPKAPTIDHIPNEILLVIFEFAVIPPPPNSTTYNFRRVVSLTHVCRHWMEVLLGDCRIWSNVHIYGQDFDMLDAQIKRCQQAFLRVFIEEPSRSTMEPFRFSELQRSIQEAASLILEHRDQVTRLHLRIDCRLFQRLLGCNWPNLRKLLLEDVCCLGSSSHGGSYDAQFPSLKVLSIDGGSTWLMKVVTHLTAFKLQGPVDLDLATLAEFFRKNPSLESLELIGLSAWESPIYHQEEPIELPYLTELSVRNSGCGRALALLALPSLKRLCVSSCAKRDPWSDSHWSRFCTQLPITTLEAKYCSSLHGRITLSGSNEPGTHSLRFTEFSPATLGAALFRSFSNASLSSVTSLFLVKGMPEGSTSSQFTAAVCSLLGQLPHVERMDLCPSGLALGTLRRLSGDLRLCPELRELEVMVTEETCGAAVKLVAKMVKGRAGCRNGRKMRRVGCSLPTGSQDGRDGGTRVVWDKFWRKAGLEGYIDGV